LAGAGKDDHPAPFPEELVYRLVKYYSYRGNVVLDPFAGTGTVAVVGAKTGRKVVCIEQSDRYCQLALRRLESTTPRLKTEGFSVAEVNKI
jgi:site-specific DNA-methyltransferase (adenine-specific)